jgi:hypothetical protein
MAARAPACVAIEEHVPAAKQLAGSSSAPRRPARRNEPLPASSDEVRQIALQKWLLLLTPPASCDASSAGSRVGRQILECGDDHGRIMTLLMDTFAAKATSTISQRAGALLQFSRWLELEYRGQEDDSMSLLPFAEEVVYSYFTHLKESRAPPTRAQRCLESIGFALGTAGAEGAVEVLASQRCQGSALTCFLQKACVQQRSPFLQSQLLALELGVFVLENVKDRIFCGFMLFLVYTRSRFGDTFLMEREPFLDVTEDGRGFIEGGTLDTKTSKTKRRRNRCLPLVGLAMGLSEHGWAFEWLRLRRLEGLDASGGPLMPESMHGGKWCSSRLRSADATAWLKLVLELLAVPAVGGQLLGTHSCKSTLLSWLSKWGALSETRKILGYHTGASEDSMLIYSRDALAGPLRVLEQMVGDVRSGRFAPDSTRSGRWLDAGASLDAELSPLDDEPAAVLPVTDASPRAAEDVEVSPVLGPSADWDDDAGGSDEDGFGPGDALDLLSAGRDSEPKPRVVSTGEVVGCAEFEVVADSSSDEEGSPSSSSSSSRAVEVEDEVVEDNRGHQAADDVARLRTLKGHFVCPVASATAVAQHMEHKTLHLVRHSSAGSREGEASTHLECGRQIWPAFRILGYMPEFQWPRCKTCFGSAMTAGSSLPDG